ncbi:hypothetical protein PRIPAC_92748 [Pristionchus pacificus]|uniref:Uncharacterized protein n=1 Tax=Pristionchus pacificus TaxID=54126 RepID=A0A2A6CHU0_PRIPA|nr:hypothetical protein PRIPAC_92748 [Pristionchus pacificus]|eukprot:PDM77638.1 hypothetical protein PRIPAC_34505 [Pristionchus pacificus]
MKNEPKIAPKSADSGAKNRSLVNIDDPGWKIAARNRAAQLAVMKRTTFPDKLNLVPADPQRTTSFVLVMGILTMVGFAFLVIHYSHFMYGAIARRASYLLVYKAVHTSKMTNDDKTEYDEHWKQGCFGMYITNWTPWRLALLPRKPEDDCPVCHKVVKIRTRTLIAREPPDKGLLCPATIEWAELEDENLRDAVFSAEDIKDRYGMDTYLPHKTKSDPAGVDSGVRNRSLVNVEDPGWKIGARNRAAQLGVMQRTTFPSRLALELVSAQSATQFVLIVGIVTVIAFVFLLGHFSYDRHSSMSRRASYLVVYKAIHSSKMTHTDKDEYDEIWKPECRGVYITNWTPWRLALLPRPPSEDCTVCHKVVKIRTRMLVAREPPRNGDGCPATIEYSEVVRRINDHGLGPIDRLKMSDCATRSSVGMTLSRTDVYRTPTSSKSRTSKSRLISRSRLSSSSKRRSEPSSTSKSDAKISSPTNCDDAGWKIASRNRAALLAVMKRTTFPEQLAVEPVNAQKTLQLLSILGIFTVVAFVALVVEYNMFMRNSLARRTAHLLVYQAKHSSEMTKYDRLALEEFWYTCPGMYMRNWTAWRLALRPVPTKCPTCHKVVTMRTRVLVATEPPQRGKLCPATIEWSELDPDKFGLMIFDSKDIKTIEL